MTRENDMQFPFQCPSSIKFYWNTAQSIHAAAAKLSGYDETLDCRPGSTHCLVLGRKCSLTPKQV